MLLISSVYKITMKKITLFFVFALLLGFGDLFARAVSVDNAKTVAINFFKVTASDGREKATVNATLNYTRVETDNTVDFYVFNITPGPGFVIVAANDVAEPVLGYSTEANFESNLDKTGVVDWMKHAAQHIYRGIQENLPATTRINTLWSAYNTGQKPADAKSTVVAPLVYTAWNQSPYYNYLCPLDAGSNTHAVTGCVATTMAQIMKYWSYPAQGTGSYSYNDAPPSYSNNYGTQTANFGATTYNWSAMPISISSNNVAIGTLMYQCGVSVGMDYGTDAQGGSGAQVITMWGGASAQNSYVAYFSYNPNTIQGVYESSYSASDWFNLMKTDLDAGRPVQYVGSDPTAGGHTWVCDGYDGNGLLHMNWGWGGTANGYFNVNSLTAGGYNFSTDESALIGIEPLNPNTANQTVHVSICVGDTAKLIAPITNHATYTWSPTNNLSCPTCAYTIATPGATTVYTAKVDSAGTITSKTVVVSVYPRVSVSATSANLSCYGAGDGVINITVAGGIPTYTYNWNNGLSSASVNTLSAGNYSITISDAVGCSSVVIENITQPQQINATVTATGAPCASASGTATVTASGGAGSLTYMWSNAATTTTITGLVPANYVVTVTDSRNCTTVVDAQVTQPYQIEYTTAVTNTVNGHYIGTAGVENVTGGTSPYTYAWSDGETTATITNLEAGIYTVTISDHAGCYEVAKDTVISTPAAGINSISNAFTFSVYPNPASTHAFVVLNKVSSGTVFKLENVLGQTLLSQAITDQETQLDLSSYPDGVYFIEVRQGDKRGVKQFVLSR